MFETPTMDKARFVSRFKDIVDIFKRNGWKVRLTIWNDHGEEWEITPVGARQTKKATIVVPCTVEIRNAEQTQEQGP